MLYSQSSFEFRYFIRPTFSWIVTMSSFFIRELWQHGWLESSFYYETKHASLYLLVLLKEVQCSSNIWERQPHPPSPTIHARHPCKALPPSMQVVTGSSAMGHEGSPLDIHSLNISQSEPFETEIGSCHCLTQISPVASQHTQNET